MGGNVPSHAGPPEATLAAAAERLQSLGRVAARSPLYSTRPVGYSAQPRFVNAVVALETDLDPHALLDGLLRIEEEYGRDRASSFANGPRTLDLDILLFANVNILERELEIPHPRLAERAFVLVPLHAIAPLAVDPISGKTVSQLLGNPNSNAESAADAVVQVESEIWRAGADRGIADPGDPPRTIHPPPNGPSNDRPNG